jgi:serine/threonine-protein kinase
VSQLLTEGQILVDRYEIVRFHAAGGMQEVYYAYDLTLDRYVAVKIPKAGTKDRRFRRGAEMGARVNHPNVAATLDYFENDYLTFMVEEFISGRDLNDRLANEFFFLDPHLAAHVSHHVAKALYEAHKMGICHRDLKPSNIMTSFDASMESIKLTDFGIAKLAEAEILAEMELFEENESTLLSSNTLLGAVPYMAPECWEDWKSAGMPMDIWALGCIMYHLLNGEPPFGTGHKAIRNSMLYQHGNYSVAKPSWFGKHPATRELESNLWELLNSCLAVNPQDRPSAEDLMKKFNSLMYATGSRKVGVIITYPIRYANGATATAGIIAKQAFEAFFHASDFYGNVLPSLRQKVSFTSYPGVPIPRCSPVLLLR